MLMICRYSSDSGGGARHHPTRAFHMLRAETIVWTQTLTLLDAMYMVQRDLAAKHSPAMLFAHYSAALDKLQPPLPSTARCSHYHCLSRPTCFTDFMPHYASNMTIEQITVGRTKWSKHEGDAHAA